MRAFRPSLGITALQPPTDEKTDKFGGIPWGFPNERWPRGKDRTPQSLVLQKSHDEVSCDLGGAGRMLFVFQAPTWWETGEEQDSTALVIEPHDLTAELAAVPRGAIVHPEAHVRAWEPYDDDVSAETLQSFYEEDRWLELDLDRFDGLRAVHTDGAKLGGAPVWGGGAGPTFGPGPGWRFLIQFAGDLPFPARPKADALGSTVVSQCTDGTFIREEPRSRREGMPLQVVYLEEDDRWLFSFANLAMGWGMVFVAEDGRPHARFVVQR